MPWAEDVRPALKTTIALASVTVGNQEARSVGISNIEQGMSNVEV